MSAFFENHYLGLSLLFGAIGIALLVNAVRAFVPAWQSRHWPATEGRLLEAALESASFGTFSTLNVKVRYEYTVKGVRHEGRRISFRPFNLSGLAVTRTTTPLPGACPATIYYDPARPERSVLRPGVGVAILLEGLLGACLTWPAVLLVLLTLRAS